MQNNPLERGGLSFHTPSHLFNTALGVLVAADAFTGILPRFARGNMGSIISTGLLAATSGFLFGPDGMPSLNKIGGPLGMLLSSCNIAPAIFYGEPTALEQSVDANQLAPIKESVAAGLSTGLALLGASYFNWYISGPALAINCVSSFLFGESLTYKIANYLMLRPLREVSILGSLVGFGWGTYHTSQNMDPESWGKLGAPITLTASVINLSPLLLGGNTVAHTVAENTLVPYIDRAIAPYEPSEENRQAFNIFAAAMFIASAIYPVTRNVYDRTPGALERQCGQWRYVLAIRKALEFSLIEYPLMALSCFNMFRIGAMVATVNSGFESMLSGYTFSDLSILGISSIPYRWWKSFTDNIPTVEQTGEQLVEAGQSVGEVVVNASQHMGEVFVNTTVNTGQWMAKGINYAGKQFADYCKSGKQPDQAQVKQQSSHLILEAPNHNDEAFYKENHAEPNVGRKTPTRMPTSAKKDKKTSKERDIKCTENLIKFEERILDDLYENRKMSKKQENYLKNYGLPCAWTCFYLMDKNSTLSCFSDPKFIWPQIKYMDNYAAKLLESAKLNANSFVDEAYVDPRIKNIVALGLLGALGIATARVFFHYIYKDDKKSSGGSAKDLRAIRANILI